MSQEMKCIACGNKISHNGVVYEKAYKLGINKYICHKCAEIVGIKGFWDTLKYSEEKIRKKYEEEMANRFPETVKTMDLKTLESCLADYIVSKPDISMKKDEVCYIQVHAKSLIVKNAVIGNIRSSSHTGVSKHGRYTGGGFSASTSIRGNVAEKYDGRFYITNQRMVLNAPKHGFDLPLEKIDTIDFKPDGLIIYSKGKSYMVETETAEWIRKFVLISNEYRSRKPMVDKEIVSDQSNDRKSELGEDIEKKKVALLREYKALLDDGIITQEEFDKKKAEILK